MSVAKRKREEDKEKVERANNSINKYFINGPVAVAPKPKVSFPLPHCISCTDAFTSLLLLSRMPLSWKIF